MAESFFYKKPYPHFVTDNFLSERVLLDARRNWPGVGNFAGEVPGNYTCDLIKFQDEGYWGNFRKAVLPVAVVQGLGPFAEYLEARYPGETNYFGYWYGLMQSSGDYGGHDVHNHHYHDPTWAVTLLCYLDYATEGHSGTTVLGCKPGLDEVAVAAQTLNWHDLTEEVRTVEYKGGRLFGFLDNVVAYHSVKPSLPPAVFGRRILRVHTCVSTNHCQRLYGVDYAEYQQRRQTPSKDPVVLGWLKRDLEQMRSVKSDWSTERRDAWMAQLGVSFRVLNEAESVTGTDLGRMPAQK